MAKVPTDRVNITLRIPEHLRARLEDAASGGDRSLNAEITERLEKSFVENETLSELFGDDRIASFLLVLAGVMRTHREHLGTGPWRDDPQASEAARGLVNVVMAGFLAPNLGHARKDQPGGPPMSPETAALTEQLVRHLTQQGKL